MCRALQHVVQRLVGRQLVRVASLPLIDRLLCSAHLRPVLFAKPTDRHGAPLSGQVELSDQPFLSDQHTLVATQQHDAANWRTLSACSVTAGTKFL